MIPTSRSARGSLGVFRHGGQGEGGVRGGSVKKKTPNRTFA
jgi:hypothetical protein